MRSANERFNLCMSGRVGYPLHSGHDGGFFGLNELSAFTHTVIEPCIESAKQTGVVLDFSHVKSWDIAALQWLTMALHRYRTEHGLAFRLRLPQSPAAKPNDEIDRSADYLRRWRFDQALLNIDPDLDSLLVPEQAGYFEGGPRRFYREAERRDEQGVMQQLLSRRLAQIRNLVRPPTGDGKTAIDMITDAMRDFQSERIGDILVTQCGLPKRTADLFSTHLVTEALLNVREHPNATVGLVAVSALGTIKRLVLSVADNGDPIPLTIYDRYRRDKSSDPDSFVHKFPRYDGQSLTMEQKRDIIHHATLPGVTRKSTSHSGQGLSYIKQDTIEDFHGDLIIVSDGVSVRYTKDVNAMPTAQAWPCRWRGNLLRISLPIR